MYTMYVTCSQLKYFDTCICLFSCYNDFLQSYTWFSIRLVLTTPCARYLFNFCVMSRQQWILTFSHCDLTHERCKRKLMNQYFAHWEVSNWIGNSLAWVKMRWSSFEKKFKFRNHVMKMTIEAWTILHSWYST